jgi:hypothetical protein
MKEFTNQEKMQVLVKKMKEEKYNDIFINFIKQFQFGEEYKNDEHNGFISECLTYGIIDTKLITRVGCDKFKLNDEYVMNDLKFNWIMKFSDIKSVIYNYLIRNNMQSATNIDMESECLTHIDNNLHIITDKGLMYIGKIDDIIDYMYHMQDIHKKYIQYIEKYGQNFIINKLVTKDLLERYDKSDDINVVIVMNSVYLYGNTNNIILYNITFDKNNILYDVLYNKSTYTYEINEEYIVKLVENYEKSSNIVEDVYQFTVDNSKVNVQKLLQVLSLLGYKLSSETINVGDCCIISIKMYNVDITNKYLIQHIIMMCKK